MEHLVYYDIAAAFVLLTALVAYHLRKYSDNFQSRVYRVMLYALLVVSTSDFLLFWEEITFGKTGTTVLLYICILGQVVAAAAYLLYIPGKQSRLAAYPEQTDIRCNTRCLFVDKSP